MAKETDNKTFETGSLTISGAPLGAGVINKSGVIAAPADAGVFKGAADAVVSKAVINHQVLGHGLALDEGVVLAAAPVDAEVPEAAPADAGVLGAVAHDAAAE